MRQPPPRQPDHPPGFRFLVVVAIVVGIVVLAASLSSRPLTDVEWARLGSGVLVLTLAAAGFSRSGMPLGHLAQQAIVLLGFGTLLIVGYSYRDEVNGIFGRALDTIDPSRGVQTGPNAMRFLADDGGQFTVDAMLNGVAIHFLVDTGASGIVLSRRDAERLGFQPGSLGLHGAVLDGQRRGPSSTGEAVRYPARSACGDQCSRLGERGRLERIAAGHELPLDPRPHRDQGRYADSRAGTVTVCFTTAVAGPVHRRRP